MGKASRDKGAREERAVVTYWKAQGVDACRVPLSGATDFAKGDVMLHGLQGECKVRADGFKTLYGWLGDNDFLTVRADRQERLYVVTEETMVRFFRWAGLVRAA